MVSVHSPKSDVWDNFGSLSEENTSTNLRNLCYCRLHEGQNFFPENVNIGVRSANMGLKPHFIFVWS